METLQKYSASWASPINKQKMFPLRLNPGTSKYQISPFPFVFALSSHVDFASLTILSPLRHFRL